MTKLTIQLPVLHLLEAILHIHRLEDNSQMLRHRLLVQSVQDQILLLLYLVSVLFVHFIWL